MPKGPLTPDERQACMAAIMGDLHASVDRQLKRYPGKISGNALRDILLECVISYLEIRLSADDASQER